MQTSPAYRYRSGKKKSDICNTFTAGNSIWNHLVQDSDSMSLLQVTMYIQNLAKILQIYDINNLLAHINVLSH